MNLSRINERNIVIKLLRRNLGDNIYAKKAYSYYRADFVRYFAAQEVKDVQLLYRQSFAELISEFVENRANLLGTGPIFSLLLLIAWNKLRTTENSVFPEEFSPPPYQDMELLHYFLRDPENHQLAEYYLVEQFKLSSKNILKSKKVVSEEVLATKMQELISSALNKTLLHIRNGRFKAPLSATIFTYCYRILQNEIRDWNKSAEKRAQYVLDEIPNHYPSDEPPEDSERLWIEAFQTRYASLKRYHFENTATLVKGLLNKLDEECQRLISMFYLEGYTYEDINKALDIKHAKTKTYRCKETLRNRLDDVDYG